MGLFLTIMIITMIVRVYSGIDDVDDDNHEVDNFDEVTKMMMTATMMIAMTTMMMMMIMMMMMTTRMVKMMMTMMMMLIVMMATMKEHPTCIGLARSVGIR